MTNGYNERDKDELVFHSYAQHPFKTISQTKSALSGQKRGVLAEKLLIFCAIQKIVNIELLFHVPHYFSCSLYLLSVRAWVLHFTFESTPLY